MRLAELCAGYGGLGMALELAGWPVELAWYAETDSNAVAVMAAHHPGVPNVGDLTAVDWSTCEPVDIISAGYPCQPFSTAGKRLGMEDERWIWPDIAAAVRVLRPRWVLLENVAGHLARGASHVFADLAAAGYVGSWRCVRASDVRAPHRRERLFILAADAESVRDSGWSELYAGRAASIVGSGNSPSADASCPGEGGAVCASGLSPQPGRGVGLAGAGQQSARWREYGPAIARWERATRRPAPAPTEPGVSGKPRLSPRFVEWLMGLPAGYVADHVGRNAALRILGNGVVPQQGAHALTQLAAHLEQMRGQRQGVAA